MTLIKPPLYNQSYINTGEGPVVILLHGLFGNTVMWKSTVDALKKDHRVIIPRLPLFDLPARNTNVEYLAKVLHEFLNWNQLTDVTLVGHAIGGQVALLYTAKHPANVQQLVLTASAGLFENFPFLDGDSPGFNDLSFVQEKVQSAFFQPDNTPKELVEKVYNAVTNVPRLNTVSALSRSSRQYNVAALLNKLDHSVLLVWGLDDKITPPEVALHFHDFLPNSEIKFIEQCGHVPMMEQPEIFNGHVSEFLRKRR